LGTGTPFPWETELETGLLFPSETELETGLLFPSETELETDLLFLVQFLAGTEVVFPSETGQSNMTPVQSVYETVEPFWGGDFCIHSGATRSLMLPAEGEFKTKS
jgi:hypothetical protein